MFMEIARSLLWPDGSGRIEMYVLNATGHQVRIERFVLDGKEGPIRVVLASPPLHGEPMPIGSTSAYIAWAHFSLDPVVFVRFIDLETGKVGEYTAATQRGWGTQCELVL